jgi:hypothetical protein
VPISFVRGAAMVIRILTYMLVVAPLCILNSGCSRWAADCVMDRHTAVEELTPDPTVVADGPGDYFIIKGLYREQFELAELVPGVSSEELEALPDYSIGFCVQVAPRCSRTFDRLTRSGNPEYHRLGVIEAVVEYKRSEAACPSGLIEIVRIILPPGIYSAGSTESLAAEVPGTSEGEGDRRRRPRSGMARCR